MPTFTLTATAVTKSLPTTSTAERQTKRLALHFVIVAPRSSSKTLLYTSSGSFELRKICVLKSCGTCLISLSIDWSFWNLMLVFGDGQANPFQVMLSSNLLSLFFFNQTNFLLVPFEVTE